MSGLVNPFVIVPLISWGIAQVLKFAFSTREKGRADWNSLVTSGGMPSSHTAIMAALATTAFVQEGFDSPIFGVCLIISLIVVYDALHVRRASGLHGQAILELIEIVGVAKLKDGDARIVTSRGHKPNEVLAGGVLGIALALLLQQQQVRETYTNLFSFAGIAELKVYGAIFIGLLIGGCVALFIAGRNGLGRLPTGARIVQRLRLALIYLPIVGMLFVWFDWQQFNVLGYRKWVYLIYALVVLLLIHGATTLLPEADSKLATERDQFLKDRKHQKELRRRKRHQGKRKK